MIRYVDVRFDVYRRGGKLTELYSSDDSVIMMMDSESPIKTSLQGSFRPNPIVNWITDEIHPVLIIDGQESEYGVFLPTTVMDTEEDGERTVELTAYDRCWLMQSNCTEEIIHFSAGSRYLDALHLLLTRAGVTAYIETPTAAVFSTDREDWDVGTDYLTIANDLLREINYKSLWFNASGMAVIEPKATPDASHIQRILSSEDVSSLVLPQKSVTSDVYSKPNVFICVCSNPDLPDPLKSVAVNDNPHSPLSVQQRGRRIAELVKVDNIPDQATLDSYAKQLVLESMQSSDVATVTTALLPAFGVEDVVALDYGGTNGIFAETAWSLTFAPGAAMQHSLRKVAFILNG